MSVLDELLLEVGSRILWRTTVLGQVVGAQSRLRSLAVEHADLHRCRTY
jgi:hypothetical protein